MENERGSNLSEQLISHRSLAQSRSLCYAAAAGLFVCGWLLWSAGRMGISHLLSNYALRAGLLIAADRAATFSPSDPAARRARATVLLSAGEYAAAASEFERAVALRPRDYVLWLELGQARDQAGEIEGAIAAFKEATRLAPYYAQPRWQLGNTLLRAGRYDEAFAELRRASASNPALLPNLIDLAYGLYNGNVGAIEQAVQSQTPTARLWLARICARNGKADEALRLFRAAGPIPDHERQALMAELLSAKRFPEAYEVWASGRRESNRAVLRKSPHEEPNEGRGPITDGGFEDEIETDTSGFGWQIWRAPQVISVSLNAHQPHNGSRSLLIEWSGDLQPSTPVVSQLIMVEPKTRYRLRFWARAEELVTGGPPTVTVSDPGGERLFGQSAPLSQATSGWSQYSAEFETTAETRTALIAVRRQGCGAAPCPIFGRAWFDDFTLNGL